MKNILFLCIFCFSFAQIQAQCNFDDLNLANIVCNNNGTPSNSGDDYITFTLDPTGTDFDSGYEFVNIAGFPVPTLLDGTGALNVPYGVQTSFRTGNGTAVGTGGVYQITIVDDLGNCTASETISAPGNCSNLAPCNITSTGFANIHCSNNGTGSTGADDQIVFDLLPSGTGLGTGYNVTVSSGFSVFIFASSQAATNLPYDLLTTLRIDEGSANGQPFNITITDNVNSACSVTINVNPGITSCSSGPDNGINLTNLVCNDNGTPSLFSDDFLTFTIQPFPPGSNLGYSAGCSLAATTLANGAPANNIPFGPPVDLRTASGIHFFAGAMIFYNDNAGGNSGFANIINPCFNPPCDITSSGLSNVACNNNGTPATAADDYITFRLRPLGDFIGTGYFVDGDGNPSATSNVIEPYPYGPIFNFRLQNGTAAAGTYNLTVTDDPTGTCTFPIVITAPGTCSTPPAPCDILNVNFLGNPGACDDNGTPNNPNDDFFTQNIQAAFINRPLTGSLQIASGGDQIGSYSIPVGQIIGNSHTFNGVQLKADGTPTVITMNFTDDPTCSETETGPTVQACSTPPAPCDILTVNFLGNPGTCDDNGTPNNPNDDFFTQNIQAAFINRPSTGSLQIASGGDQIGSYSIPVGQIIGNSHTFNGVQLKADGTPTVITMNFTDDPTCSETETGPTVQACSTPALCSISSIDLQNKSTCNDNGTADNPADDFFTADVVITYINPPTTGNLLINPTSDALGNHSIPVANLVGNSHTFLNVPFKADGTITSITVSFSVDPGCVRTATDAAVSPCSFPPPVLTCPLAVTVSCVSEVPPVDLTSLSETHTCPGNLSLAHVNDVISNEICVNRKIITRTYQAGDACGNLATCSQIITVNDQIPPTLTCPASQTVSCANNLPASNTTLVTGLSDNCGGATPIVVFVNDVISNQTCTNRFTLTRTYRASDECGNSATCSQIIIVNDQTPPSLTCPASQTVSCANNLPANNTTLVTGLSDNCGGTTPIVTFVNDVISNQTCTNCLTLTRTYRASDECGNSATCTQTIIVNDQTPPTFTFVPASTVVDCHFVPAVGTPMVSDNCGSGATVHFLGEVQTPGICPVLYTLTRTWQATDACGNSTTTSQIITVTDTEAPQFLALPQATTVECGPANAVQLQNFLDNHGGAVAEDCTAITFSYTDSPVQEDDYICGLTFQKNIRFVVTDACGNVAFREASFTVTDQIPPVFSTPPQSLQLECDASRDNGETAFFDWLDSNAGLVAEDVCSEVTLEKVLLSASQGCGSTWQKTYEFRARDACGNLAKTTATFAIVDHTPPTLVCPPNGPIFLACIEDLPAADPAALTTWDCSSVTKTLQDTWTVGTGCPGWMMTVAYRYAATDDCGNEALCEQAFYVQETDHPTLVCPDTIKLICVDDIPGPQQLFGYIKNQLVGNCAGGFTGIRILTDSGRPQNGTMYRRYTFVAKNHCGLLTPPCSVIFQATGICHPFCTTLPATWGDPNGAIGGIAAAGALQILLTEHGPVVVGGGNHTVSAVDAECVQEMLFSSGNNAFLPTAHSTCPLPTALANPDGSLNNQLAANAMALQLNIWYNRRFNDRDLGIQTINNLPSCLVQYPLLKDLGQHTTVQDLLDLTNLYLQGVIGNNSATVLDWLNTALDNLNHFRVDCELNAPCERPDFSRNRENAGTKMQGIQLVPNPATEAVTITFESATAEEMQVQISDGRTVRLIHKLQSIKGLNTENISLKDLSAGVYWVTLQSENGLETLRLVKVVE